MITHIQIVTNNAKILVELIEKRATLAQQTDFNIPKQVDELAEISEQINEAMGYVDYYTGEIVREAMR
jgi:hypothetical protein